MLTLSHATGGGNTLAVADDGQSGQLGLGLVPTQTEPLDSLISNRRGPGRTRSLAPAPVVDRYPIIIGSHLSLQYLSSVMRLCLTGWRYSYVDALNELFEHDPQVRGVLRQRVLPVAGATLSVMPASLPDKDPQTDLAKEIADEVQRQIDNLPSRAQSFGQLAWGGIYGVTGAEAEWERTPGAKIKWEVRRLHNIHSRRLNYTNPNSWDVYVWDQGAVNGGGIGPTNGPYGLRVADYPGKFVIHAPALNGDYPTRDGEGRYIAMYMAIKRMMIRCTSADFERTIRPWVLAYLNRDTEGGKDPIADDQDEIAANRALNALGTGSMNYAILPNSVKIEILRAASNLSSLEFIKYIDEQLTKSILGQTFTTQPGAHGNKNAADTAKQGTLEVLRYEAQCFADTLERDLVWWIVCLNWGNDIAKRLTPRLIARVEEKPDPETRARVAKLLTEMDVALDADDLAEKCGYKTVPAPPPEPGQDPIPRRTKMVMAGQPPAPTEAEEPTGTEPVDGPVDGNTASGAAEDDSDEDLPTDTPAAGSTEAGTAPPPADPTGDPT